MISTVCRISFCQRSMIDLAISRTSIVVVHTKKKRERGGRKREREGEREREREREREEGLVLIDQHASK